MLGQRLHLKGKSEEGQLWSETHAGTPILLIYFDPKKGISHAVLESMQNVKTFFTEFGVETILVPFSDCETITPELIVDKSEVPYFVLVDADHRVVEIAFDPSRLAKIFTDNLTPIR